MKTFALVLGATLLVLTACQNKSEEPKAAAGNTEKVAAETGGLSAWETEHGVGPIKSEVKLGEIDKAMAEKGKKIFESKCNACHKFSERYVGPALGEVLSRRKPEYVMNMIMNSTEMIQKHPEAKKLFEEFLTPMPAQDVKEDEARALVEYIRTEQTKK